MSLAAGDARNGEAASLRVALLQTDPVLGQVEKNLAKLQDQLRLLPDSDVAVAPELALHGYHLGTLPDVNSLALDDPRLAALGGHSAAVIAGFAEHRRHDHFNSAAVIDRGHVQVQRKLFLPTYRSWEEGKHFRAGSRLRHFDLRGTRVGVLICNDLWQPPMPWLAVHAGAEVLVVIANSVHSHAAVPVQTAWDLLIRHAAVSLQCYVVFVNRVGTENGAQFWGGSRVVGPDGEQLARLGDEPDIAEVTLDLSALRALRREWPLLREPRLELVGREIAALAADQE